MEKSVIGSVPNKILGLIRERNNRAFPSTPPVLERSLFEHSRRESIVKFPFATTRKNIQIDYFQRIGLSQTAHFTDQRCLPPTARRNQHRIHTVPEVGQQTGRFFLAVGKIVTRMATPKTNGLFSIIILCLTHREDSDFPV